jgi:cation transport ATPase
MRDAASPANSVNQDTSGATESCALCGKEQTNVSVKEAILDVAGADHVTCVHAIEQAGAEVQGVTEIRVDAAKHEIRIVYDDGLEVPRKIEELVAQLGYSAALRKAGGIQE